MLDYIKPIVASAIGIELEHAQHVKGKTFHSAHEGYGVLFEELFEAKAENEQVDKRMNNLLHSIHQDNIKGIINNAGMLELYATNAACEYVQVAAMARKLRLTMEGMEGEH